LRDFVCGVLSVFDEINFYICSHSFIERVIFFGYMKSAVLSQQCTVTAFGVGFYCRVLQEGQTVTIHLISHLTEEKSAGFSLHMVLEIFRYLTPHQLALRQSVYGQTYKFIFTKTQYPFV
jgi:hypothetical protein